MKIVCGFISYNKDTLKYLPYFLPSLKKSLTNIDQTKILAVDNSENFSSNIEYIKENYPEIDIIHQGVNLGFAVAYNLMIERAIYLRADYFLVINPDIIFDYRAIYLLYRALEKNTSLSAVSPKILNWPYPENKFSSTIDSLGIIEKKALRFIDKAQGKLDSKDFDDKILAPSGAAGLFRLGDLKELKTKHGYYDQRMFLYKEDVDLAYRMKLRGYKSATVLEAVVAHDRSLKSDTKSFFLSFKNRNEKSKFGRSQSFLNQHILYLKYFSLQSFYYKIIIIFRIILLFSFALLKERFLLKNYLKIVKIRREIKKQE